MRCVVQVPASTSNLGPGFDCLGLALEWLLTVEVETGVAENRIENAGASAAQLPPGAPNLVYECFARVVRPALGRVPPIALRITSDIPVARGLGSSGAAAIAGLLAGALVAGPGAPDLDLVLQAAVDIEGHPDNVAASLYGGLTASVVDGARVHMTRLPFPASLSIIAVIPDRRVETHRARALLPESVPLADAVFNLSRVALLAGALASENDALAGIALADRLHQDRRLGLVPGLATALDALRAEPGCVGAVLSGSGPTLLAFVRDPGPDFGAAARGVLAAHGVPAVVRALRPQLCGATWTRDGASVQSS